MRLFGRKEKRQVDVSAFFDRAATKTNVTGRSVTPTSAIEGTVAVYACVSLLAETVGSLPLHLFRRIDDRNRERIREVPLRWPGSLARTLHESPNPEMTGQEYWETVQGHVELWGNHFSYIVRAGDGRPQELWPLRPDQMEVLVPRERRGLPIGGRRYVYTLPTGEKIGLNRNQVLHVRDFATDGVVGLSKITVARLAVGIDQAAGEYAGRFFGSSAIPGGILKTDAQLTREKAQRLRETWESVVGGLDNAQRIAVLHSGIEWEQVGIPPKDAQFIELRRFQLEEAARMWRIPPHLLGDTTKESSWGTGIEQMTIGFVVYTLGPKLKRLEDAISRDLADPDAGRTLSDESLFAEFRVQGLVRGDLKARSEFYSKGIQDGWLTPEDARALENLPFIPGLDRSRIPANFVLLDGAGRPEQPSPPPEGNGQSPSDAARAAYEEMIRELKHTGNPDR